MAPLIGRLLLIFLVVLAWASGDHGPVSSGARAGEDDSPRLEAAYPIALQYRQEVFRAIGTPGDFTTAPRHPLSPLPRMDVPHFALLASLSLPRACLVDWFTLMRC